MYGQARDNPSEGGMGRECPAVNAYCVSYSVLALYVERDQTVPGRSAVVYFLLNQFVDAIGEVRGYEGDEFFIVIFVLLIEVEGFLESGRLAVTRYTQVIDACQVVDAGFTVFFEFRFTPVLEHSPCYHDWNEERVRKGFPEERVKLDALHEILDVSADLFVGSLAVDSFKYVVDVSFKTWDEVSDCLASACGIMAVEPIDYVVMLVVFLNFGNVNIPAVSLVLQNL